MESKKLSQDITRYFLTKFDTDINFEFINYKKEIFCQQIQFYLDTFHSNKGNLEKKKFLLLNIYVYTL